MDIVGFITFSVNTRYMLRWIAAGLMLLVPVLNLLSIGYLSKASNLFLVGGVGLPTWEEKGDIFRKGAYLLYIMILYLAVPSFLFSCWFLLVSFGNLFAAFMGGIMKLMSAAAFVGCSFFVPFAFCAFSERMELSRAFDFEAIVSSIKQVWVAYVFGYLVTGVLVYIAFKLHRIPYLGFLLSSVLTYYILLVATYYFTTLFKRVASHSTVA
jgi:hypothetical protein